MVKCFVYSKIPDVFPNIDELVELVGLAFFVFGDLLYDVVDDGLVLDPLGSFRARVAEPDGGLLSDPSVQAELYGSVACPLEPLDIGPRYGHPALYPDGTSVPVCCCLLYY